jgi:broad specificity phosphatase PhoE
MLDTPAAFAVTPERFAQGMRFDDYLAYIATPENLKREGSGGGPRIDRTAFFRDAFSAARLSADQAAAFAWLLAQPRPPARMLVISEEWSSDCRRDVPTFARIAADTGIELRIFARDGQRFSAANTPDPGESPNADLVAQFLNHKRGATFQSIPVCAFFTADFEYLYHFTEFPAIYDKDRVVQDHIRAARPGESAEQTRERSEREFAELMASPFWRIWASATVDEILSALHRKAVIGTT